MTSKFKLVAVSKNSASDATQKGKTERISGTEKENSLFALLKSFNDYSQEILEEMLITAGLDKDRYLVLQNIEHSISIAELLISTGFTYQALRLLLKKLEKKQYIKLLGSEDAPALIRVDLTDVGTARLRNTQEMIVLAEQNILKCLPQNGILLKNALYNNVEEDISLAKEIEKFNDDLAQDGTDRTENNKAKLQIKRVPTPALTPKTVMLEKKAQKTSDLLAKVQVVSPALPQPTTPEFSSLSKWALENITKNQGIVSLKDAYEIAFGNHEGTIGSLEIKKLAQKLSAEKIGLSPDPKFSFKQQKFDDHAVLFNLSFSKKNPDQEKISKNYCSAYLMLHLGMKAAQSDNNIADAETDILEKMVLKNPELSQFEKTRLQADMLRLKESKISLEFIASMLRNLSPKHKEKMAHLAFMIITSDNIIEESELNFLLWLYNQLHFSQDQIQEKIKMIGDLPSKIARNFPEQLLTNILKYSAKTEVLEEKKEPIKRFPMPSSFIVDEKEVREVKKSLLNENRVVSLQEDTNNPKDLLHTIFSENDEDFEDDIRLQFYDNDDGNIQEETGTFTVASSSKVKIEGLDEQHQKLFLSLFNMGMQEWDQFEIAAREYGLMANGAVENLNEWGYEKYGEAVIEYDPFYINIDFYSEVVDLLLDFQDDKSDITQKQEAEKVQPFVGDDKEEMYVSEFPLGQQPKELLAGFKKYFSKRKSESQSLLK